MKPYLLATGIICMLLLSGCTTHSVISNKKITPSSTNDSYGIASQIHRRPPGKITLVLSFSGGGSRAAALSYGVLKALRQTPSSPSGNDSLLSEVDVISAVSGGSFTAAYYVLHGERTFAHFENDFLNQNIQENLITELLYPSQWFSNLGRTDIAADLYEQSVFKGATFADLGKRKNAPLLMINASDLSNGVRFSFIQEYFDLLCSDLSRYPISRAVTASSSVPVLFNPVVVENFSGCSPNNLLIKDSPLNSLQLEETRQGLLTYLHEKEKHRYLHLVDGGITDNLGLRAIYDFMELSGGPQAMNKRLKRTPSDKLVVIVVNASTQSSLDLAKTRATPSIETSLNAMTDIQIHRYNATTLELFERAMASWSTSLSTPQKQVTPYFIELNFKQLADEKERQFFNAIPTGFNLSEEQKQQLIEAGGKLLQQHPKFQQLLNAL
ncbi:patatin-like phospholipase family protein [Thiomicrorhabdus sp. 6S3-12]|uniref:patatin-like phospholipase family protein n=1 Tax=Thiomicrorhabdus sp. 6S3-12 TaxID=2819681 RepID=UPI001AAD239B|nr:patatin-like phospholipase family protein [Thiomicrorhabdus sp. 6S3-12]MBO1924403.1 patatin-like phospholipase family protein [Thiomicrorhabdus sp. 6S3-12]